MMRFTIQLATLTVYICIAGTAVATSYRMGFSGTMFDSNESYNGYAIMDYSTPNSSNDPGSGSYDNAITHFELEFGGTSYTFDQNQGSGVGVRNDSLFFGIDGFSISLYITDTADDSAAGLFFLQLIDPSMTVFSSIELPTSLSIEDFDLTSGNTFQTGVVVTNESTEYFSPIDFVHVAPVPLPAGLLLLLSGVSTFFAIGYRGR